MKPGRIFPKRHLKSYFLLLCATLLLCFSCGSSRNNSEKMEQYSDLQELVNSREFMIENQWAQPLTGSRINLIGNTNYMRFKNDSINLHLPYFGVRHSGGGYDREGGINYEGPLKNLEINENPEKNRIKLNFKAEQNSEDLSFIVVIFSGGKVNTSVTSSQRNTISYDGEIEALPEKFK